MTNHELLTILFNQQNPIFVNAIFQKNEKDFLSLGYHIKTKNLVSLPLDRQDFEMFLYDAIKAMKTVKLEMLEKFSYKNILRRIFVQQIISAHRKFLNNKEKILSIATNEIDQYDNMASIDSFDTLVHKNYDLCNIYNEFVKSLKTNKEKQVFNLYLNNVKPAKISKIVNEPIKKIYNTIFMFKNECAKFASV